MTTIEPSPRTPLPDRSSSAAIPSLERLLDRTGEREQPLLDENGYFADETHRLAALLEDTRVPFHAIGQFVDSALVSIRPILTGRKPGDQIPDRSIFLPSVPDVVDRRPCPYGSDGNLRHLDLTTRPIGKAGIGGERHASQGESNGDGHSETSHVPPQARHDAQEVLARDRTQGSDHEQSRAFADNRERNPIDLAVKCNADHAHTAAANVDQTRRTSCD